MDQKILDLKARFPRKSVEDRKKLILVIINEYFNDKSSSLNSVLRDYALNKKLFYEWMDKYELRHRYTSMKWSLQAQGRSPKEIEEVEISVKKEQDNQMLLKIGEFLHYVEKGMPSTKAAAKVGENIQNFYYHFRNNPHLKVLYENAKILRFETLKEQRVEQEINNLELADKAREELLQRRQSKSVTKKKGIEIIGGRAIDVETTSVTIKELEPDKDMIKLTYALAGFTKDSGPKVDVHVEVLGTFEKDEAIKVQEDSKKILEDLKKRREQINAKSVESVVEDIDFDEL